MVLNGIENEVTSDIAIFYYKMRWCIVYVGIRLVEQICQQALK
jgi:hypothetical protein